MDSRHVLTQLRVCSTSSCPPPPSREGIPSCRVGTQTFPGPGKWLSLTPLLCPPVPQANQVPALCHPPPGRGNPGSNGCPDTPHLRRPLQGEADGRTWGTQGCLRSKGQRETGSEVAASVSAASQVLESWSGCNRRVLGPRGPPMQRLRCVRTAPWRPELLLLPVPCPLGQREHTGPQDSAPPPRPPAPPTAAPAHRTSQAP